MFRKILMCAVLTSPFLAAPASADSYDIPARAQARPRPLVLKGYYGADAERQAPTRSRYVRNIESRRAADAWHIYAGQEAAYANSPGYVTQADIHYTPPVTIYSQVPGTPIRVYYVTRREPYYNVPPHAVQTPFFFN
jgi:hypothetical protein